MWASKWAANCVTLYRDVKNIYPRLSTAFRENMCSCLKRNIDRVLGQNHELVFKDNISSTLCSSLPFNCLAVLTNPSFIRLLKCFEEGITIDKYLRLLSLLSPTSPLPSVYIIMVTSCSSFSRLQQ